VRHLPVIPAIGGSENRDHKKQDPISKITRTKGEIWLQMVKYLPIKDKVEFKLLYCQKKKKPMLPKQY
jgi:ABC-type ATPase with predicted acetyltransferase domain